ncbi:virulence-associated E family protein [Staphylococcus pseudintermedius]|uniref:virulence-associated E family protein n=1 Tax=Staphylococcus pseudintermedius TaxID=283734 RepID=UPI002929D1F6|nr:virulence-associated E family protein [Staphylococcus pseudintermedius]MDU9302674.1 virulence-associated E family protein [Staphylococcus pseudintermedius]
MLDKVTQPKKIKYDRDIQYAFASSRLATNWTNHNMAWSDFMQKLSSTVRTKESLLDYNKMSKSEQANVKDVGGFVGGYLKEGKRRAGQVMNRSMLTLDIDYAAQDMVDMLSMFYDFAYCVYSTHKHRDVSPRLRLVVPLKRNVNSDEYEAVGRKVADMVGMDYFDDTTYQPHRLMYWPSTSNDAEFFFAYEDLPLLDPDKVLDEYVNWTDTLEWPTSSREESKTRHLADKQGNPEEKPGIVGAFCRAYSIEEAIQEFIPELYDHHSSNRYTYHEGSTSGGLVLYENGKFAYSHHNTDPVSGLLVNSFDLIRIHLYGAQDEDLKADTPINRLPSYKAMQTKAQNDERVKKQLINDKISSAADDFDEINTDDDDSWDETLEITSKGTFKASIPNIEIILHNDSNLKGKIAFNEFTKQIECLGKTPWNKDFKTRQWQDGDDSALRSYIEKIYEIHHSGKTKDAIISVALQNAYHPVRDYLNNLEWDKKPRLEKLFIKYLGVKDTKVNRTITRKALTAGVARVMEPGCKFDYMLTLYGPQGVGKSAILKKLGGGWFSDSLVSVTGKEAYEALQGVWIMEMAELAATRKAEVEAIKHFISKQIDRFRVAYGHYIEDFPRQCIFIGTTNKVDFLRDETGGRRFWPMTVNPDKVEVKWSKLTKDEINQIWAEAKHYYEQGEELYLDPELEEEMRSIQSKHTEESPYLGIIEEFLNTPIPSNWNEMSISERRDFYKFGDDSISEQSSKLVQRDRVCALEIFVECFGKDKGDGRGSMELKKITNALRQLNDWEVYDGNKEGKLKFGKEYGKQKAYVRQDDFNDLI